MMNSRVDGISKIVMRIVFAAIIAASVLAFAACSGVGAVTTVSVTTVSVTTEAVTTAGEAVVTTASDAAAGAPGDGTTPTSDAASAATPDGTTTPGAAPTSDITAAPDEAATSDAVTTSDVTTADATTTTVGGSDADIGGGAATSPDELLESVSKAISDAGVKMPMSTPPMEVTAETSQNTIGLSEEDFNEYVVTAYSSMAAIGTFAHQMAVVEAKDGDAATAVKDLISGDGGYDAEKWICVRPDKCAVIKQGNYVLLVAASADVVDAAADAYGSVTPETGAVETVIFYEAAA